MPQAITAWLHGRLPSEWFVDPPQVEVDRDEILVIGELPAPDLEDAASDEDRQVARRATIEAFREHTRETRMRIAREAESEFGRKVSWGVRVGDLGVLFTHLAAPAMTRLRMRERRVLDTLVEAGIARSRADALAWCVRLVGQHEADWLADLRAALTEVNEVRRRGPYA